MAELASGGLAAWTLRWFAATGTPTSNLRPTYDPGVTVPWMDSFVSTVPPVQFPVPSSKSSSAVPYPCQELASRVTGASVPFASTRRTFET